MKEDSSRALGGTRKETGPREKDEVGGREGGREGKRKMEDAITGECALSLHCSINSLCHSQSAGSSSFLRGSSRSPPPPDPPPPEEAYESC